MAKTGKSLNKQAHGKGIPAKLDDVWTATFQEYAAATDHSPVFEATSVPPSSLATTGGVPASFLGITQGNEVQGKPPVETADSSVPASGGSSVYNEDLDGEGASSRGSSLEQLGPTGVLEDTGPGLNTASDPHSISTTEAPILKLTDGARESAAVARRGKSLFLAC